MAIKKRLVKSDNYYEYSTNYLKKYVINIVSILFFIFILLIVIYFVYFTVPSKSFAKKALIGNKNDSIIDENGKYYTGIFTNLPVSIPIKGNMKETLYLYLFHDNYVVFWKLYKNDKRRDFYYNSFNLIDKDYQTLSIKEPKKDFLDFYDNFIKAQFKKNIGSFYLEIPYFYNSTSHIKTSISNLIESDFYFMLSDFYASMVNWGNNKALYIASLYGLPYGNLKIPGGETVLTSDSGILAINIIGESPVRYEHSIVASLLYTPYSSNPIPLYIYKANPESHNSRVIRFLYNGKWTVYTNFETHEYKNSLDNYSKEDGFSFVYTKSQEGIEDNYGVIKNYKTKTDHGLIGGYITIDKKQLQVSGVAVREYLHSVF